ncbi:PaaI family thioesterase [bacterium]|nr:PaaI family thioesterase [bacterium]MBU1025934.1 PaaI family thioesterase [bacterium]
MTRFEVTYAEQACFVCGQKNQDGFRVSFILDGDDGIYFNVKIPEMYQGYDGIVHGGMISTMLDEVMANCFFRRGIDCVTIEINVRFLKALPVEKDVKVVGKIEKQNSRFGFSTGWIEDNTGTRYAEGNGKFYLIAEDSDEVIIRKSFLENNESNNKNQEYK